MSKILMKSWTPGTKFATISATFIVIQKISMSQTRGAYFPKKGQVFTCFNNIPEKLATKVGNVLSLHNEMEEKSPNLLIFLLHLLWLSSQYLKIPILSTVIFA